MTFLDWSKSSSTLCSNPFHYCIRSILVKYWFSPLGMLQAQAYFRRLTQLVLGLECEEKNELSLSSWEHWLEQVGPFPLNGELHQVHYRQVLLFPLGHVASSCLIQETDLPCFWV